MQITSKAFSNGGKIPSLYTCDDKNINPPLEIHQVPKGTVTLVLIMDDPDVPPNVRKDGLYVHWVVYNMPPDTRLIAENSTPPGTQGKGTGGVMRYDGPCPPDREHRYYFKLYALKTPLNLKAGATKSDVETAMEGIILEEAQLMGRYVRLK